MRAVLLLYLVLPAPPAAQQPTQHRPVPLDRSPTAFIDVTVIPMDSAGRLEHQTVMVRDGRIERIGPSTRVAVPEGTRRVDGTGKFLIPGLVDSHVHLRYLATGGDNPALLALFPLTGVTTVVNLMGLREHLALRDSIARGKLFGPELFTSGFYIGQPYISGRDRIDSAVGAQARAGYDFVKLHGELSAEDYATLMAAARREKIRVIGHAPRGLGMATAFAERQDVIAHAEEYLYAAVYFQRTTPLPGDSIRPLLTSMAQDTKAAGSWVMPTLSVFCQIPNQISDLEGWLERPAVRFVPRSIVEEWRPGANQYSNRSKYPLERKAAMEGECRFLEFLVKFLNDADVPLLAGTDTPVPSVIPGFGMTDELEALVRAGLTPYEALETATINAAVFLDAATEFGRIRAGLRADLVLLDADPLLAITNVGLRAGVMLRGRWLPREEIERTLEAQSAALRH